MLHKLMKALKQVQKKALAVMLVVCMGISMFSVSVSANGITITYLDEKKEEQNCSTYTSVTSSTTIWADGWYIVDSDVVINSRIIVKGTVNLILLDGYHLNASTGINVSEGNSLTVYGQKSGTGTLVATAGSNGGAGIGGDDSQNGGTISIHGGTVTAIGYSNWPEAAGIGGGYWANAGDVTITGGTVTATGASAGIGKDGIFSTGNNGSAFITASNISDQSKKENWSGVIFEGDSGKVYGTNTILTSNAVIPAGKTLTIDTDKKLTIPTGITLINEGAIINNGTVVRDGVFINSGTITGTDIIPGGTIPTLTNKTLSIINGSIIFSENYIRQNNQIYAYSTKDGTINVTGGIATKNNIVVKNGVTSNIKLSNVHINTESSSISAIDILDNGVLNLTIEGENNLHGICGIRVSETSTLTIQGSATDTLTAAGKGYGAGIGNSLYGNCGTVTINSGSIIATGGSDGAAGIGGGRTARGGLVGGRGGTININGGSVIATGGNDGGAGIGGGGEGNGGNITISGGKVVANSASGAGIGAGRYGSYGSFSTGLNGHAVIIATDIRSESERSEWRGVIFEGGTGVVYGTNVPLTKDFEVTANNTLSIGIGNSLIVADGVTLINKGSIINNGTLTNKGIIKNYGTIIGNNIDGTVQYPSTVDVTFTDINNIPITSAAYGDTIKIKATAQNKASKLLRSVAAGEVGFWLGAMSAGQKLNIGKTTINGEGTATITVEIGTGWKMSDNNTITADFGGTLGTSGLIENTGTSVIMVNKINQTAPILAPINETISGKADGSITGLTTAMEYSKTETGSYTAVTNADISFAAGNYYIRYAETDDHSASLATKVTIASGKKLTVILPTNPVGYTLTADKTELDWNDSLTITYLLKSGYTEQDNFAVLANGMRIEKNNESYTVANCKDNIDITVTGVADITSPTGEIIQGTNKWNTFLNTVTFGWFFKETQTINVTATDEGSGIAMAKYLLSESVFDSKETIPERWNEIPLNNGKGSFSINPHSKQFIYVKLTDHDNNVTIINSDGIVVYEDATATDESAYTLTSQTDLTSAIDLKGNTVKTIKNGEKPLKNSDYKVENGKLVFSGTYLDTLDAGNYTLTVSYNPLGETYVHGTNATDSTVSLTVNRVNASKADTKVTNDVNKTYDGKTIIDVTYTSNSKGMATIGYKVKGSKDDTYTTTKPVNAGEYTVRLSVAHDTIYEASSVTKDFVIKQKDISQAIVQLQDTLLYAGKEQTQSIKVVTIDGKNVTYTVSGNKATEAGNHEMVLTGTGNYMGTKKVSYAIVSLDNIHLTVNANKNAAQTTILTSKYDMILSVLTADELAKIADGAKGDICLEVKNAINSISDESKQLIAAKTKDYQLGMYLDINLFKKLSIGKDTIKVTDTNKKIEISIRIPENLINKNASVNRTFYIVRNHNGSVEILDKKYNPTTNTLIINTDQFSDYALMYWDESIILPTDNTTQEIKNPQTGDFTTTPLCVTLLILSTLVLAGFVFMKKEIHWKNSDENRS